MIISILLVCLLAVVIGIGLKTGKLRFQPESERPRPPVVVKTFTGQWQMKAAVAKMYEQGYRVASQSGQLTSGLAKMDGLSYKKWGRLTVVFERDEN